MTQVKDRINVSFPIALGQTIICSSFSEDLTTAGGIIIPETAESKLNHAIVMAVGAECKRKFVDFNGKERPLMPGDKIIHNTYANLTIMFESNSYLVLSEHEIYAVIPDGAKVGTKEIASRKSTSKVKGR